jgi:uncharacterized protein YuzE
VWLSW